MDDTLSIKDLDLSTLDAANFPGSARSFPRIQSDGKEFLRQSLHVNSRSPSVLRVSHVRRNASNKIQRSVLSIDQTLARVDASSNPIGADRVHVKFQVDISEGITQAEYESAYKLLIGALLGNSGALLTSVFNAEV